MEFLLLGSVEVRVGGRVVNCGGPRQRTVLAALAIDAGRPVLAETIIDRVWGSEPPARARHALHVYVGRIRETLRSVSAFADRRAEITRSSGGYLLQVDPDCVDMLRFRRLANEARDLNGSPVDRAALLRQALALWRGEPLADLRDEWPAKVREGWRQHRIDAALRWANGELELSNAEAAVGPLADMLGDYPLDESISAMLMRVLCATGRASDALDCYVNIRQRLADQLGIDPGAELQRLHQAVLRRELDQTTSPSASARARPPSKSMPAQLPPDVHGFTGRSVELANLQAILDAGADQPTAVVISALSGMAGVGKTALAVHFAHRNRELFRDGQLFVDLCGFARTSPLEPIRALTHLLRGLGVEPEAIPTDPVLATDLFRSLVADRRMLILLDNAHSPDQVRPLLPGSAGCIVLVTSRVQLPGLIARDGARGVPLDVLALAEALQLLGRLLGDKVNAEPAATAELAELCGRMPLALRIAAANFKAQRRQSIMDYVVELRNGDRLARLAIGEDESVAVRSVFDLSYQGMDSDAQKAFRLLGLIPGRDFAIGTAAALIRMPRETTMRLVRRLVGVHLLREGDIGRFMFHDLLQLYAAKRAEEDETARSRSWALRRVLEHYVCNADAAARLLYPQMFRLPLMGLVSGSIEFDTAEMALDWLDRERENLVAAITEITDPELSRFRWRLADLLRGYFWYRRLAVDWLTVALAGLAATERAGDVQARAAMQLCLADAYESMGRFAEAISHQVIALSMAQDADWLDGQIAATGSLGTLYHETGRMQEAAAHHTRGLALSQQANNTVGQAVCLGNLARVNLMLGRLQTAFEQQTEALNLFQVCGAQIGEANTLANLGDVCLERGEVRLAHEHAVDALTLQEQIGDRYGEAYANASLATASCHGGQQHLALESANRALALSRDIGERRAEAESLLVLGYLAQAAGRYSDALDRHHETLRLSNMTSMRYQQTQAMLGLAAVHLAMRDHDEAGAYARQAIEVGRDFVVMVGHARMVQAAVDLALGRRAAALDHARHALAIQQQTGHGLARAGTLFMRGPGTGVDAKERWENEDAVLMYIAK